jgi:NAD(P)-dependent dehydrogenase (short-subunit alcohol dehydrogenase family)
VDTQPTSQATGQRTGKPATTPAASGTREGWRPGVVLVTGGASGLGAAVAQGVAAAGGTPVVLDRAVPPFEVDHQLVDLARTRAAEAAVRRAAERHGSLDAVVTAAGIDRCGTLAEVPGEEWDRVIAVNLLGTAAVVRAALPWLTAARGRVVTVASTLGLRAVSDASAYCASKFGVVGFTRALAAETAGRIGVTLLVPGGMHTAFFDNRTEQYKPPADAKLNRPEDVAAAVLFALRQPPGCELREMVVCPSTESSWP